MRDFTSDDELLINVGQLMEDSDWKSAFDHINSDFVVEDISTVCHAVCGQNEGDDWICYGVLKDGRWFCMHAGCDYTGWDCQAGGGSSVHATREEMISMGMTREMRQRFKLLLSDDKSA